MKKRCIIPIISGLLLLASCGSVNPDETPDDTGEVKNTIAASETAATTTVTSTNTKTTAAAAKTTTTKAIATTVVTAAAPAANETSNEPETEAPTEPDPNEEDKKILRAINELEGNHAYFYLDRVENGSFEHHNSDGELIDFKNLENYMVYEAENLPIDRELGSIADEQDLIEKARNVLLNAKGQWYMDWLEKEPKHDPDIEYVRENPPIIAQYYDEYDVWFIYPTSPSWKRADGEKGGIVAWSEGPSFMCIRGSDGKILGCCLNY